MIKIQIVAGSVRLQATLEDNQTGRAIADALPFEARANIWGEEIYFEIPMALEQEPDATAQVEVGDLGYWPVGRAFCIFFGPTPASTGSQPVAASPVNLFGRVDGDPAALRGVPSGAPIRITKLDPAG